MNKAIFLLACFLSQTSIAQNNGEITMKKDFWGFHFYQDGKQLYSTKEVLLTMQPNQQAFEEFAKARSNYNASIFFSVVGGFMIGWPIGQSIGGGRDPQWGLVAGGAVLAIVGLSFEATFNKRATKALSIYNDHPMKQNSPKLFFSLNGSGAQLSLKF